MKTIFITGATGVVGSSLVPVLLKQTDLQLKLLIRARSAAELAIRLEWLCEFWGVGPDNVGIRSRIRALAGDTTLPQFGLDQDTYRSLSAACTHIIHAAGLVRMNLPLDEARHSAIGSVRNVIALARASPMLQKVDIVSTVGVGGRLQHAIPERWLTEPRAFHNTYEQAKAEAEDFLRERVEQATLPATVHRPSMVVGDSRDGRIINFQVFYFLCEFLSGRRTLGVYPDFGDARLDIIGCDIVAEAIAAASADPGTIGQILHLCSGPDDALRIADLKQVVRQRFEHGGVAVPGDRVLSRRLYASLSRLMSRLAPGKARKALAALPIYLEYLADSQAFDDAGFRRWLAERGQDRPAPAAYLPKVLDYYFSQRYGVDRDRS